MARSGLMGMQMAIKRPESGMDPGPRREVQARLARLAHRPQTFGADLQLHRDTFIQHHGGLLDVRPPHAAGMSVGEAYVVPEGRFLPADLTLCHSRATSSAAAEPTYVVTH